MQKNISDYRILSIQDLQTLLGVSKNNATKFKKDIQKEFNIENKPVLFKHFQKYFNLLDKN